MHLDWLRQPNDPIPFIPLPLAYFAMITANTWLGWPLNAVVATGALQSIPGDLYEAAEMDGANAWQKFRTVTVTYLRPAMLPYAIYGFVITFNLFFLPYFMTGGGPFGRTEILVTQAYRLADERQLLGVAAAFSVYLFFLLLVVTLVTNRLAKATRAMPTDRRARHEDPAMTRSPTSRAGRRLGWSRRAARRQGRRTSCRSAASWPSRPS